MTLNEQIAQGCFRTWPSCNSLRSFRIYWSIWENKSCTPCRQKERQNKWRSFVEAVGPSQQRCSIYFAPWRQREATCSNLPSQVLEEWTINGSEIGSEDGGRHETLRSPLCYKVSWALILQLFTEVHLCAPIPMPSNLSLLKKILWCVFFNFAIAWKTCKKFYRALGKWYQRVIRILPKNIWILLKINPLLYSNGCFSFLPLNQRLCVSRKILPCRSSVHLELAVLFFDCFYV